MNLCHSIKSKKLFAGIFRGSASTLVLTTMLAGLAASLYSQSCPETWANSCHNQLTRWCPHTSSCDLGVTRTNGVAYVMLNGTRQDIVCINRGTTRTVNWKQGPNGDDFVVHFSNTGPFLDSSLHGKPVFAAATGGQDSGTVNTNKPGCWKYSIAQYCSGSHAPCASSDPKVIVGDGTD